ncbi:hypothetical protein Tco_0823030 [Tanacetum coccineum]|uniref:Reverse transcriptase domain-containing protein n=1 Tax=Tanacetum coccineum TaxID=301880 RepID=A0ABQ5AKV4_9ASTR
MQAAQDRQKNYVDRKRKPMEYEVGDRVMLKFVEEPVEIMEREIKRLKRSRIPLVKVRWNSRRGLEFTWEREDKFKQKYPQHIINLASSPYKVLKLENKALLTVETVNLSQFMSYSGSKLNGHYLFWSDTRLLLN